MKIIKASVEFMEPVNGEEVLRHLERCGRICYKSEGKIEDGSAEKFIRSVIKRGHESVLEHASFCFEIDSGVYYWMNEIIHVLSTEHGFNSFVRFTKEDRTLMSGNVRAWRDLFRNMTGWTGIPVCFEGFIKENPVLFPEYQDEVFIPIRIGSIRPVRADDLETENEILTHCDKTVLFVVDRGVSHEIVRHRIASFSQESTRYCNYSKDGFGGEIAVIQPLYLEPDTDAWVAWEAGCKMAEAGYFALLNIGLSPQEARAVLPNSLKTEVVMTANIREWRHFLRLRCSEAAHPQMREVANMLLDMFYGEMPVLFEDVYAEVHGND